MRETHSPPTVDADLARPSGPRLVVCGLDEAAAARMRARTCLGEWQIIPTRGLADAEHVARVDAASALVVSSGSLSAEDVRGLRRRQPTLTVLVWSAGLSSEDTAAYLLAGAFDVLSSRMSDVEIRARVVRSIPRSAGGSERASTIGDLSVDTFRGEAHWRGQSLPLSNRERDVLDVLVQEQGQTLRRQVIYQRVWGHAMPAGDRNVDVNVKRLREKLAAGTGGEVSIETVSRVGYRLLISEKGD